MNIAVCDDNKLFLEEIGRQLEELPIVESLDLFSSLEQFLHTIREGQQYHAVLMDIHWQQGENGLDAAERLYGLCPETKVIYVTGYNDRYAQQIFLHRANLSGYLTKPVDGHLLHANLQKAADSLAIHEEPVLVVQSRGNPISIPVREIFYLESQGHNVLIHTAGDQLAIYNQMSALLRTIPEGFIQCHKSFAVNMRKVQRFQAGSVLLKNGALVPVSRARYAAAKAAYFEFMGASF